MTEPKSQQPSANADSPSAGRTAAQIHHHEMRFLKALRLLIETGRAKTTDDLIRYAEQDNQAVSINYLKTISVERVPVDLAFDALSVNLRLTAHKRNNTLLQHCRNRKVGLVLPLPPHVIDAFTSLMPVTVFQPDGHHAPFCLEGRSLSVIEGSRESRNLITGLDTFVFEAYFNGTENLIDANVADVVDFRILPVDAFIVVHRRPHQNPNDVVLNCQNRELNIL
jgi:hypothetical protein